MAGRAAAEEAEAKKTPQCYLSVDAVRIGPYHRIPWLAGIIFDGPHAPHTLAIRGDDVLLVEVKIVENQQPSLGSR
jgi:hypothetical protein